MHRLTLIERLDARDREMFNQWVAVDASALARWFWCTVTRLGGATLTIGIVLATIFAGQGTVRIAGLQAAATLLATHLVAQALKRTIVRPRPAGLTFAALVAAPDRFSFPSGHAIAATSLAVIYVMHFPVLAPVVLPLTTIVAVSRVRLGVHYPGDVLVGQIIAVAGAMTVMALW